MADQSLITNCTSASNTYTATTNNTATATVNTTYWSDIPQLTIDPYLNSSNWLWSY